MGAAGREGGLWWRVQSEGVRGAGADSAYQSRAQAEQRVPLCQQSSHNADLCKEHRSCP